MERVCSQIGKTVSFLFFYLFLVFIFIVAFVLIDHMFNVDSAWYKEFWFASST